MDLHFHRWDLGVVAQISIADHVPDVRHGWKGFTQCDSASLRKVMNRPRFSANESPQVLANGWS